MHIQNMTTGPLKA